MNTRTRTIGSFFSVAMAAMKDTDIAFDDAALTKLIREYTREAGLRNLEREIASIIRKVARKRAEGLTDKVEVTPEKVEEFLGAPVFMREELEERTMMPGVAIGLSWTAAGGEVLYIEATQMWGQKGLSLTGQLGDVMVVERHGGRIDFTTRPGDGTTFRIQLPAIS